MNDKVRLKMKIIILIKIKSILVNLARKLNLWSPNKFPTTVIGKLIPCDNDLKVKLKTIVSNWNFRKIKSEGSWSKFCTGNKNVIIEDVGFGSSEVKSIRLARNFKFARIFWQEFLWLPFHGLYRLFSTKTNV